jgi:glycosyltransferase involved in cell wall biosynthesis
MNLSLCITTYNRFELLKESYAQVIDDRRISEIIIVDDCSTEPGIKEKVNSLAGGKVKVFHQVKNRGMAENKMCAISYASNDFAIILDSDNSLGVGYIDAIYANESKMSNKVILSPEFAYPEFDFRKYSGQFIDRHSAKKFMNDPMFRCFLNCCNYCVPKNTYIKTYQHDPAVKETDTIAFNYHWLNAGYSFYMAPGCKYNHLVHKNSGFLKNIDYNMVKAKEFENKIMQL